MPSILVRNAQRSSWFGPFGALAVLALALIALAAAGCGAGSDGSGGPPDVVDGAGTDVPTFPDGEQPADLLGADGKPTPDVPGADLAGGDDVPAGADVGPRPDAGGGEDTSGPCAEGEPCDDGDPCTGLDRCDAAGVCAGTPVLCDDGRTCTDDACDSTGTCAATLKAGWCLIDALCRQAGARPDDQPCLVCDPAADPARWTADDAGACDDGDACTTGDHCAGGRCVAAGAIECPAAEPCADHLCDAATGDCVRTPHGGVCDDGSACTTVDQCVDGACVGFELACADPGPCRAAACDPLLGCVETEVTGSCDDGSACTTADTCVAGACMGGVPLDCDDGNPCTDDSCHPWLGCDHQPAASPCCDNGLLACDDGDACTRDDCDAAGNCTHESFVGPCDDGDACTEGDVCDEAGRCRGVSVDCDDDNACTADSCDAYLGCRNLPVPGDCDDGDPCTVDDQCRGGACAGTPLSCDDGVPCTRDFCDELGVCQHELTPGLACDDGDACTTDDTCDDAGACRGQARTCDDANVCTDDTCDAATGCVFTPASGAACDDGDECTVDDVCQAGACVGTSLGCACGMELSEHASKVTSFAIGTNGQPGNGLDVDDDPATCAPPTNCSGGVDNSMAGIAGPANEPIADALADGDLIFLFEHRGLRTDGVPYELVLLTGDPVDPIGCDFQTETCDYWVDENSYAPDTCAARISFDNATLTATTFRAGGPGYTFPFSIPIQGLPLSIDLFNARIVATPTFAGPDLAGLTGIIGGAVPKQQLIDAVNAIPDDQFPAGMSKAFVLSLLNLLITDDIDTDGDGRPDAASIGIRFVAIDANLAGIAD
jgi:hypothetical protein